MRKGFFLGILFLIFLFPPSCLAEEYFFHTTEEDFASGFSQNIDYQSSPGSIQLAVKPQPPWWDSDWRLRYQIQIENQEEEEIPKGYTLSLTFNHHSLVVARKSLENGDDVRLVYQPEGESPLELDRILAEGSSWNSSQTTILFQAQESIFSKSGDYFLYFANPQASPPPSEPKKVFAFWEDFEGFSLGEKPEGWEKTDWAVDFVISGEKSSSGNKSLKLIPQASWVEAAVYRKTPVGQSYLLMAKYYTDDSSAEGGLYFRGKESPTAPYFGFFDGYWQINSQGTFFWNSCLSSDSPPCPPPQVGSWNTLKIKVVGGKILEAKFGDLSIWWKDGSLPVEFSSEGERVGVRIRDRNSGPIFYDDFALRLAKEKEPILTLIEEKEEYEGEGTLESIPFEATGEVGWDKISWDATLPEGTKISFQVATSADGEEWSEWSDKLIISSGSSLAFLPPSRFIKYKVSLKTTDSSKTPLLHEVRIFPSNAPPEIVKISLISSTEPYLFTTSTLTAEVTSLDKDGDEIILQFFWFKNGQEIPNAPNQDSLSGDYFQKGEAISVLVVPFDGKSEGIGVQSAPRIVGNLPPSPPSPLFPQEDAALNFTPPSFNWQEGEDLDSDPLSYEIEIDTLSDFSSGNKLIATVSATTFTPSLSLAEGQYFWRLRTRDGEEVSSWSRPSAFVLDLTPPSTIISQGPPERTRENTAKFVWEGQDNFSSPLLFSYSLDGEPWVDFAEMTSIIFQDLPEGLHSFMVRGKDRAGNIEETASFFWEIDRTPPSLPSQFLAQGGVKKVHLSWSSVSSPDLAGYNLYRSLSEDGDFQRINPRLITETSFVDEEVEEGGKYFYRIASVDDLGNESPLSLPVGVVIQKEKTPEGFSVQTLSFPSASPPGGEVLGVESEGLNFQNSSPVFSFERIFWNTLKASLFPSILFASFLLFYNLKRS